MKEKKESSTATRSKAVTWVKYLSKGELRYANNHAIKAGCRAIEPEYVERLPENHRYPVSFTLPWERHGWVRCQIGTATCIPPTDYTPVWLDVPAGVFENLSAIPVGEEVSQ